MTIKKDDITVAIATYNERYKNAIRLAKSFVKFDFKVVIIHQTTDDFLMKDLTLDKDLDYQHLSTIGVTNSRNKAIDYCKSKYLWFMDDDISILDELNNICDINFSSLAGVTLRVTDETGNFRKRYPDAGKIITRRDSLSVGTIELIVDVEFIKLHGIYFPVEMGAGSLLPVGDEAVFLSRIICNGGMIKHVDLSPISHPKESSGTQDNKLTIISKGYMLKKVYGFKGIFPLIYLIFKLKGGSKSEISFWLLKGFFK